MRTQSMAVAVLAFLVLGSAAAADARSVTLNLDIPSQGLNEALQQLALASRHKLFYKSELVEGRTSPALKGEFTTEQALKVLLDGTNLTYDITPSSVVLIRDQRSPRVEKTSSRSTSPSSAPVTEEGGSADTFANAAGLEEVIVTAQKREERIQDVPIPVTVVAGEALAASNQVRLRDYYARIPGLNLTPDSDGTQTLSIRGISNGQVAAANAATVGVMIDDVPFGSSFGQNNGVVPELDPGDLARVEVLRGPQGTLYGASSLGGLLKFVTTDPSIDAYRGRIEVGTSAVRNGNDLGYTARGSINVPLSETIAVRASAFTREDPGYIDNPVRGIEGLNEQRARGGRLSALWKPSDAWSVKFNALYQTVKADGSSDVHDLPTLGDLEQNSVPGAGGFEHKTQAYSATLNADFGKMHLTAISGYSVLGNFNTSDLSATLGPLVPVFYPGTDGAIASTAAETKKFTQEVRFTAPLGSNLELLLAGFYTRERHDNTARYTAVDAATGAAVGPILNQILPSKYSEYAAFADLTWQITERVDVQLGARQSRLEEVIAATTSSGPLNLLFGIPDPFYTDALATKADATTFLFTPRFKVSPDLLTYARVASGYRAGGPLAANEVFGVPRSYKPDKTVNYELGLKGDFLEHRLAVDASVYYIDWRDIQITRTIQVTPTFSTDYVGNGATATSKGVELSIQARPVPGLEVAGWVVYNDAKLAAALPPGPNIGFAGDRLPFGSRWSANLSINGEFPLTTSIDGFAGVMASYSGDRVGIFQPTPVRQYYPSYTKTDLSAGIRYDSWTLSLFVNNVTDERALLTGGMDYGDSPLYASVYIQPRTFGLSLVKEFN